MPIFMHQWSYKDQQVRRMLLEPKDRAEVVRTAVEAFGGTLLQLYYCFGDYDAMAISDFPDNETALACVMSIFAQGRIDTVRTTPLLSAEEGLRAMRQAGSAVGAPAAPAATTPG